MDELQKAWLKELELQNQKTILVRELGTRYWDKDGNPVGSIKGKTVVPEGATLNKLAVKGYTKKHKSRPITPIFYSHDDIIRMVKDKFGTEVRKTHIPPIISNPDYILAPKGQPPIGRSKNIEYLVSRGYAAGELNRLQEDEIRRLGNQERGEEKKKLKGKRVVKTRNFITISELPQWSQAVMRERRSKAGFGSRGYPTPDLTPALRAEMRGTALYPGVFSYRWADPFQLEHTMPGIEGGEHIPMQGDKPQYTAMLESEHTLKTAEEARKRAALRKGLTVTEMPDTKKQEVPTITKNSKWRSEAVYDGPPLKSIPDSMPTGVVYRVEGHPYWVVDYYDGHDNLIRGVSTHSVDSDNAIDSKMMLEGEENSGRRVKEGKYKGYHVDNVSPFQEMKDEWEKRVRRYEYEKGLTAPSRELAKRGLRRLPGFLGILTAGALAPEEVWAAPFSQKGLEYGVESVTGLDLPRAAADTSRLRQDRIGATIAQDTIVPLAQMMTRGLSSENIPQEPYYGMGRQRGLLDTGHPGIGRERQKRRTNIWT